MTTLQANNHDVLLGIIEQELKPLVRKIDVDGYYPKTYLQQLGMASFFQPSGLSEEQFPLRNFHVVYETSKVCMTTGFVLWCHLAAITYLQKCNNPFLKREILPHLQSGKIIGGTGLSNPMKYYAGLEKLHLKAEQVEGGYEISGQLPYISNLCKDHWFGLIASVQDDKRIMAFVPCNPDHIQCKEKNDFLGLNGSATLTCKFDRFFVPNKWIISEDADTFVEHIRPTFIFYQIPLGFGVIKSAVQSINKVRNKQEKCNQFLQLQSEQLQLSLEALQERIKQLVTSKGIDHKLQEIIQLRLQTAYLTLDATQANMLHHGGAAYLQHSQPFRLLKEGYFFANLTPTVKHLEKLICQSKQRKNSFTQA